MPLLPTAVKDHGFTKSAGSDNYLNPSKVGEGDKLRFTILGDDSLVGFQCWVDGPGGKKIALRFSNEPTRSDIEERASEQDATVPDDCDPRKFMAFSIWNYELEKIQIFQFTQSSIATPLIAYLSDEEIEAEPHLYDFVLSATGSGKDKRYNVASLPGRRRKENIDAPITVAWKKAVDAGFKLDVMLAGGDPFKGMPF